MTVLGDYLSSSNQQWEMPTNKCLHELFEEQALKTPNKTAIIDYYGRSMTYKKLNDSATILAKRLKQHGCKTDSPVGIYMERCLEYTIAYIAALKAGGCYLPIDYSYPIPLLNSVLDDAKPIAIVTLSCYKKWLPPSIEIVCIDEGWEEEMEKLVQGVDLNVSSSLDDLAYIVYSSGTTGAPKGIMCPHRGAVFSYTWRHEHYPFKENDCVASNVFFVWEMLRPLLKGVTLYVIPDDIIYDPPKLLEVLKTNEITSILLTPSLLEAILVEKDLDVAKYMWHMTSIWLCGEVVTMSLRNRFVALLPHVQLLNLYSISECHDVSASNLSKGELEKRVDNIASVGKFCPVGKILEGVKIVILDNQLKQQPIGMAGEIFVGGPTLARGYVNRPKLTESKFINTPESLIAMCGQKLYRTGDWGYMLSNGELEICGRCDSMVKIRGFSIELQAVEAALLELHLIRACKVQAHGDEGEDKYLVAYVVPTEQTNKQEIRASLKAKLPGYMIPAYFVLLTSVPIAASGKLDAKTLPKFERKLAESDDTENGTPTSKTEEYIHGVWKEVLGLRYVDTQENFFDMGGHSLLAARMLSTVREYYHIELCMNDLFHNNTVHEFASLIELKIGNIKTRRYYRDLGRKSQSVDVELDLTHEVVYHDQSFINMDMMLRAFWRSCQYDHRWTSGRVFLTGATGFLGAFLLKDLLLLTKVHVYCLVREMPDKNAEERLEKNLRQYGIIPNDDDDDHENDDEKEKIMKEYKTRVTVLKGDVSVMQFGLTNDDYAYLTYEIDFIVHAAAVVNLIYPYKTLHGTNVVGTQNILMFAGTSKIKPVHYISTDAVFPPSHVNCCENTNMTDLHKQLNYGYAQSKWVAERLVQRAGDRGLPTAIYRLGNMSGETENAYWNKSDFTLMLFLTCIHSSAAPIMDYKFEMTPVNFASRVIVNLTQQISWSMGKVYHIINTKSIDAKHLFEWISTNGYPMTLLSLQEWKERVKSSNLPEYVSSSATKVLHIMDTIISLDGFFFIHSLKLYPTFNKKTLLSEDVFTSMFRSTEIVNDKRVFNNANLNKFLQIYLKEKYQHVTSSLLKKYLHGLSQQKLIPKPQISHAVFRQLTNRVAIVTGASSGIGEAVARKLAEHGASVVLVARRLEKLEKIRNEMVKNGYIVTAIAADVTKRDDLVRLVEQTYDVFGNIDILVNSAGVMYYTLMKNVRVDEWEQQVDVNCKGVMNSVAAVLPGMLKQESGHIINISSDAGRKVFPGLSVYSATKFFVEAFSQGLRLETAESGIKVTTIQPGSVKTPLFALSTDTEATKQYGDTSDESYLHPEDIANAVFYAATQPKNCAINEILVEPREQPI